MVRRPYLIYPRYPVFLNAKIWADLLLGMVTSRSSNGTYSQSINGNDNMHENSVFFNFYINYYVYLCVCSIIRQNITKSCTIDLSVSFNETPMLNMVNSSLLSLKVFRL